MKRSCSMPFGANVCEDGSVRFRLWAPRAKRVDVLIENSDVVLPLARTDGGRFELSTQDATCGTRYFFQIDGGMKVPDPASRFQPLDVNGPSEVVDPRINPGSDVSGRKLSSTIHPRCSSRGSQWV